MLKKFFISMILLCLFATSLMFGDYLYQAYDEVEAIPNKIQYIDDIHDIDWNLLEVGDTLEIGVQNIDRWTDYIADADTKNREQIEYNPELDMMHVKSVGTDAAVVEPIYGFDLSQDAFFGTRFESDDPASNPLTFSQHGFVQLVTRPHYLRKNPDLNWSNAYTDENSWYTSIDDGTHYIKYKEDGNFRRQTVISKTQRNTISFYFNSENQIGTIATCKMPEGDTTYDCHEPTATNYAETSYTIGSKYLQNKFLAMRYYGGETSGLDVSGLKFRAVVNSMAQIEIKDLEYYVPVGTTLEEAHNQIDPRFNEFIDYQVTSIDEPIPYSAIVDDGGYDPNVVGTYKITYSVTNGYGDGAQTRNEATVKVMPAEQIIDFTARDVTVDITSAPSNDAELKAMMEVQAFEGENDLTADIEVLSKSGFDYANPKPGRYPITYAVEGTFGQRIYDRSSIRIVVGSEVEKVQITEQITGDEDGRVSQGETISYRVDIYNGSNISLNSAIFDYFVNDNYYDITTVTNVTGSPGVTVEVIDGRLNMTTTDLEPRESIYFTFDVTASDKWFVYSDSQLLDRFNNELYLNVNGESYDYHFENFINPASFRGFNNTLSVTDVSGDNLIQPNEQLNVVHTFKNDSDYSLFTVRFATSDVIEKVTPNVVNNLVVSSDKRDLVLGVDYETYLTDIVYVDNVVPNETLTVSYEVTAKGSFHNINDLKYDTAHSILLDDRSYTYSTELLSQLIPLDVDNILNYEITTKLLDTNNNLANVNEQLDLIIDIKNTGLVDINNSIIEVDLSDVNILQEALTPDMISIQNSEIGTVRTTFTLDGNKIIIKPVNVGESKKIIISVNVNSVLDATADDLFLHLPVTISSDVFTETTYENKMTLNVVQASNISSIVTYNETIGDGDNKIDPAETFEYHVTLNNDGLSNLHDVKVTNLIDSNDAVLVDSMTFNVFDSVGSAFTDFTVSDNVVNINYLPAGTELDVVATVKYGSELKARESLNNFSIDHPFDINLSTDANTLVDFEANRDLNLLATIDKTEVIPGDTVEYTINLVNNGSTTEQNVLVSLEGDVYNIRDGAVSNIVITDALGTTLVNGVDYTYNKGNIYINKLSAGETLTIKLDLVLAYPMFISPDLGVDYKIDTTIRVSLEDMADKFVDIDFTPNLSGSTIDIFSDIQIFGSNTEINPGETVKGTYIITNTADVNLTNGSIDVDFIDDDTKAAEHIRVSSDDPEFTYLYDDVNHIVTFPSLAAGAKVSVEMAGPVKLVFDESDTIDYQVTFTSDYFNFAPEILSVDKNLVDNTSIKMNSAFITTSSGDGYVSADEDVYFDLIITNDGSVSVSNVLLELTQSAANFENVDVLSITDSKGNPVTDFTETLNTTNNSYDVVLASLPAGESYTINFAAHSGLSLEYTEDLYIKTALTSKSVTGEEFTHMELDMAELGSLDVKQVITKDVGDGDGLLDPSEVISVTNTYTNTDSIAVENVVTINTTDDVNLNPTITNLNVLVDSGTGFEPYVDYTLDGNMITLNSVPGLSTVQVDYDVTANNYFYFADYARVKTYYDFVHPTEGPIANDVTKQILIDFKNNTSVVHNFTIENQNTKPSVVPGDKLNLNFEFTNNGKTVIEDLVVYNRLDSNISVSSLNLVSPLDGSVTLTSGYIDIVQIMPGETINIVLSAETNTTFNEQVLLENEIDYIIDGNLITDTATINVDRSGISVRPEIIVDGSGIGDDDRLVDPGEYIYFEYYLHNDSPYRIDDVVIDYSTYGANVAEIVNIQTSGVIDSVNEQVTFDYVNPNGKVSVKFVAHFDETFNADNQAIFEMIATNVEFGEVRLQEVLDIDIATNTKTTSSYTYVDFDKSNTLTANEPVVYTFKLKNTGLRDLADITVTDLTSDPNLSTTVYNQEVLINGVAQTLDYLDDVYSIDYLSIGDELTINYTVDSTGEITRPILRFLDFSANSQVNATDAIGSFDITKDIAIPISKLVANATITSEFVDNGDGLITPLETMYYDVQINNTGDVSLINSTVSTEQTGIKMTKGDVEVYDETMTLLVEGVDYTVADGVISLPEIPVASTYTVRHHFTAPDVLTINTNLNLSTVFDNKDTLALYKHDSYGIDVASIRSTTEELSVADYASGEDMFPLVNTNFAGEIILNNTGSLNERDVRVFIDPDETNLTVDFSTLRVSRNGSDYTSSIYQDGKYLVIPRFDAGDEVIITIQASLADNIIDRRTSTDKVDIVVNSEIIYDDSAIKNPSFDGYIMLSDINSVDLGISTYELVADNNLANAGEEFVSVISFINDGYLQQDDLTINFDFDEYNVNPSSISLIYVLNEDEEVVDPANYTIDETQIMASNVTAGSTYQFVLTYSINPTIDLGISSSINDLLLVNGATATTYYGDVFSATSSTTSFDETESNHGINVVYTGTNSVVTPSDTISFEIQLDNNGTVILKDVLGVVGQTDEALDYATEKLDYVLVNDVVADSSLYSYDPVLHEVNIYAMNPGETYKLGFSYNLLEFPRDVPSILYTGISFDEAGRQIRDFAEVDLDLSMVDNYTLTSTMTYDDTNGNGLFDAFEPVEYTVDILNDGGLDYVELNIYSDLSDFGIAYDDAAITVLVNGLDENYELYEDNVKITNFLHGDHATITYSFVPTVANAFNEAVTEVFSTLYMSRTNSYIFGAVDVLSPEVDIAKPVLTVTNKYASGNEFDYQTEADLITLFGASGSDVHLDVIDYTFGISHAIDFTKPGVYDVTFTVVDRDEPLNNLVEVVEYEVLDVVPTITSLDYVKVSRGEPIIEYIDVLNVVATEITSGDLTDVVVFDDSQVNYGKPGVYTALLSVSDNEGNVVVKEVEVEVFNSLYPMLSSEDIYLTQDLASMVVSDDDIIKALDSNAVNYTMQDITSDIKVINDGGFLAASSYTLGEVYEIDLQITNSDGYSDLSSSRIIISDHVYVPTITSFTPITLKLGESIDGGVIAQLAQVTADLYADGELVATDVLLSTNIIDSNVDPLNEGMYMVKFLYYNLEYDVYGTYIQLVSVSGDGYMYDNKDVVIDYAVDTDMVSPGDTFNLSVSMVNDSYRDKVINEFDVLSDDVNFDGVTMPKSRALVSDREIATGSSFEQVVTVSTADIFMNADEFVFAPMLVVDGETFTSDISIDVEKPDDFVISYSFDKDFYAAGDYGKLTVLIDNQNPVNFTDLHLNIELLSSNVKLTNVYLNGVKSTFPTMFDLNAYSQEEVEVNFMVSEDAYPGDDEIIVWLDDQKIVDEFFDLRYVMEVDDSSEVLDTGREYSLRAFYVMLVIIVLITVRMVLHRFKRV